MTAEPGTSRAVGGLVSVCLAAVVWGTIGPAVDVVADRSQLPVAVIAACRAAVAVSVLLAVVVLSGRTASCRRLLRAAPARAVCVGVATAAFQLLFFVAVVWVGVSLATVVCLGLAPLLLLVTSSLRTRRRPSGAELLTVVAAVLGLALISLTGSGAPDQPHPALGVLAALASGTAYALSAEVAAPLSRRHDALSVTAVTISVAGLALLLVGLPVGWLRGADPTSIGTESWLLIGYLGVATMGLAYLLFFAGLRSTPSGAAVVATLLEPLTAVAVAVAFLGERLTLLGAVGSVLILGAILTLGRRPAPAPAP